MRVYSQLSGMIYQAQRMHKRKRTSFGSRDLNQLFITIFFFFFFVDDLRGFSFVFTLIKGSLASYLKVSHPLKTTVMASSCAIALLSIVFSSNIFFFLFCEVVDSGFWMLCLPCPTLPEASRSTEHRVSTCQHSQGMPGPSSGMRGTGNKSTAEE